MAPAARRVLHALLVGIAGSVLNRDLSTSILISRATYEAIRGRGRSAHGARCP
jgi:hypothetical protein